VPILAIEGPDRSGKTTLFNALKMRMPWARRLKLHTPPELFPYMRLVDERELTLMAAMYDPDVTYIMDRSVFVSGQVYAKNRGETPVNVAEWRSEVYVAYLDVHTDILLRRHEATADTQYADSIETLKRLFDAELMRWPNVLRLHSAGAQPEHVEGWFHESVGRAKRR
jgi:thymidylate kinase